ncbi:MAG: CPBP family intramembrane glutamic endopeptidase [Anaerolineaceae bacterium]|nr:CPBP family intramembrane glutamic endopeptidase [Anaerolineaceae bacterium]
MIQASVYKPQRFFAITYAITWVSWFLAAFLSYQEGGETLFIPFLIPGLVAPFATALWMILRSRSSGLKKRFTSRLFDPRLIKPASLLPILTIMPATVLVSAWISLLFGQPLTQFQLAEGFSFSVGFVPVLIVLILAATFEELGWRSYALDSLNVKSNYFTATLIFALLWAGWHLPLFFINGYYQNEIVRMNLLYGVNFMISVIPMAFIISWLCRLNRGSILIAILFHFLINMCQEALQITQVTKCIETGVLFLIAAVIVLLNQKMFFEKPREALA